MAITLLASMLIMVLLTLPGAHGQITTACTGSMISTFTPCLNYITGSTNGAGTAPTADCCSSLKTLLSSSAECGCLILTGNVPFNLPINRTLSITLPRACKSASVPVLQCKGSATPLPAPGPIVYGPGLPPIPTSGSDSISPSTPPSPSPVAPAIAPVATTTANGRLHPLVIPSSAVKLQDIYSPYLLPLVLLGTLLMRNKF